MSTHFFDDFYARFTSASDEIRKAFEHTDMSRQKEMLRSSITYMLMYAGGSNFGDSILKKLAEKHGRNGLQIRRELYDIWLDSLLKTIAEHDPDFSAELEKAWREALASSIELMRGEAP